MATVHPPTHAEAKQLDSKVKVKEKELVGSDWASELYEAHLEIEVDIQAKLGEFTTNLGRLANLQVGDEFPLSVSDSIEVSAGSIPLFSAISGTVGESFAIRIESIKKDINNLRQYHE